MAIFNSYVSLPEGSRGYILHSLLDFVNNSWEVMPRQVLWLQKSAKQMLASRMLSFKIWNAIVIPSCTWKGTININQLMHHENPVNPINSPWFHHSITIFQRHENSPIHHMKSQYLLLPSGKRLHNYGKIHHFIAG